MALGFLPSWAGLAPYALVAAGGAALIGYVYVEGARSERARQAQIVANLNAEIAKLNAKQVEADTSEDVRVATALAKAREAFFADPVLGKCRKLDAASVQRIKDILGGN